MIEKNQIDKNGSKMSDGKYTLSASTQQQTEEEEEENNIKIDGVRLKL